MNGLHRAVAALATGLSVTACSSTGVEGGVSQAPDPNPEPPSVQEFDDLYQARIAAARAIFTEADVRFMTDMIIHHAQALVMSAWAPRNGASSRIRTLAARIKSSQQDEIERMRNWLGDRDQPVPEVTVRGDQWMMHGGGHVMPGMLTGEQMNELRQAHGRTFDRLFLAYMIQHHRGALVMVEELFASEGAVLGDEIFKFASDVNVDQATEVARMEGMLAAMPETPAGTR